MATTLTVEEAQDRLPQLLDMARAGQEVIIQDTENHKARLVPVSEPSQGPRVLGLHAGQWEMSADFDAPLPQSFWLGSQA
jgi:antitoxin (DNA-binding transcriptional repressor) of toxin-antitoxin stability system